MVCQQTQLKVLLLNHNKLATLPESISQLTSLQTLNLENNNQLTTLPESISQLTSLQTLYLGGNQLTTLPESIGQLTNLQTLNLSKIPAFAPYDKRLEGEELKTFLQKLSKGEIKFGK